MTKEIPFDLCSDDTEVVLKEVKGWTQSLEGVREQDQMPVALKDYLETLEKELDCKISIVSTGPERDRIIHMN